jgi:grpE
VVDNKNLEDDEIKDKIEEETLEEVKEEEQDLEDIKKVLEEALSAEEEANAADDASKDSKDAKIADLEDRLKRQIAEFDNFRKRTEKEKSAMFDMGARHIIEAILPTIDNFERGLKTVPEDKEAKAFYDGMEMIYKQMLKVLSDVGVTAIDCLDKEFDLNLHNAVMHVEDEAYGNNIIIEEFQKGYKYKDTVIRHSMVKVAN